MPTLVHNCCAGCGVVGIGAAPGTGGVRHWDTLTGTAPTQDVSTMAGRTSYKFVAAAAETSLSKNTVGSPAVIVGRFAVQFDTSVPSADCSLLSAGSASTTPRIWFNSADSKIYARLSTNGATGVSVVANTRYYIDYKIDFTTNPHTLDVQVNGTACAQKTIAEAASTITSVRVGLNTHAGSTANGTAYVSDIAWSVTATDYPLGDGHGVALEPAGDGTHNFALAGDFQYHFATNIVTGATNTWTMLTGNLDNITDFVCANTATATEYLEWTIGTLPASATTINGMQITVGQHASATTADAQTIRVVDGSSVNDVCTNLDQSQTSLTFHSKAYPTAVSTGGAWTATLINALKFRFLSTDVAPKPALDGIKVEVDYLAAPAPVTGSGALSLTLALAATGLVLNPVTGTGALSLKPTLAASAQEQFLGSGAVSLATPSLAGTGTLRFTGTGALAISRPVLNGAATLTVSGSGALVLTPTLAGTGTVTGGIPAVSGSGAVSVAAGLTASGTVLNPVSGPGSLTLAASLSGTGTVTGLTPVATMQLGGGGSAGRRHAKRWEEQKAAQEALVEAHGTSPPRAVPAKPKRPTLPPVASVPAVIAPVPVPVVKADVAQVVLRPVREPPDDDDDAILMLLGAL